MEQKIFNLDVKAVKEKASVAAREAKAVAQARLSAKFDEVSSFARGKKDEAVSTILAKGIELSERQLSVLKNVREKLS